MQKVYVLEFSHSDLFDCQGVFSTFEKAKKAFTKDCQRCEGLWKDFRYEKVEEAENDYFGDFLVEDGVVSFRTNFYIYATYIDIQCDEE